MQSLELRDLSYSYAGKAQRIDALKEANYVFRPGKVYAIMGRSGSGKTTLLSVLAGLDVPGSGKVLVDGQDMLEMNPASYRREKVAMVYQQYNLLPLLTVEENVMYPMILSGGAQKAAREESHKKLRSLGMGEAFDKRFPHTLSGGEQQRVAIARALCTPAKLILADEPTGNLDTENSDALIDILLSMAHEQEYLVIIVTHDPSVSQHADVCLSMEAGILRAETINGAP